MKKTSLTFGVCACLTIFIGTAAGDSLNCPYGTTPTLNGVLSPGEWTDAVHLEDTYQGSHMYVKHDAQNVYFAFDSVPTIPGDIEHCFDTENDDATTPQPDDRHYGYCPYYVYEEHGDGSYWVPVTASGWTAVCSWITVDDLFRAELRFPFVELGIVSGQPDTLGMMLWAGFNWGGTDFSNPSTWADFYSSSDWSIGIDETNNSEADVIPCQLTISPNPFSNQTIIAYQHTVSDKKSNTDVRIYDATGHLIRTLSFNQSTSHSFDLDKQSLISKIIWDGTNSSNQKIPAGIYYVCFATEDFQQVYKAVLLK